MYSYYRSSKHAHSVFNHALKQLSPKRYKHVLRATPILCHCQSYTSEMIDPPKAIYMSMPVHRDGPSDSKARLKFKLDIIQEHAAKVLYYTAAATRDVFYVRAYHA